MRYLANSLTLSRIAASAVLVFTDPFSALFCITYIFAGITDMIDGTVARKTGSADLIGERLDSIADLCFTAVCIFKILPLLSLPLWILVWAGAIVLIRLVNFIGLRMYCGSSIIIHTAENKISGFLLFVMPLTIGFLDICISSAAVCAVSSFAALRELYLIRNKRA